MTTRRDRYGEPIEDQADEQAGTPRATASHPRGATAHTCDHGWIEAADGRVRRCSTCQPEPRLTEKQWQQRVTDLATLRGWLVFHPLVSRGSAAGWPDLCIVRDGRLIFAELKTATGRVSPAQAVWLAALDACNGVTATVWRPADWPQIVSTLNAPRTLNRGHTYDDLNDTQAAMALLDQLDADLAAALDALADE